MPDSGDTPDIETGADTLLSFLEEKSKWPVSRIADDLGVPEETIKEWAQALEKSGMVEIKYSAIKGMVLEYSSEKSYEELNRGRSELELETDELEVEAEEVETIGESGEMAETKHTENEEKEEQTSREKKQTAQDEKEQEEKEEAESSEKLEGFDSASAEESTGEEEGEQRLKDELENLEKEKQQKEKKKAKMNAKKAKIKQKGGEKSRDGETGRKKSEEEKGGEDHVSKVQEKVKQESSGEAEDHDTGEDVGEHVENLKQLGDLLRDEEVENSDIYAKMDKEMDGLKQRLVQEETDEELRNRIARVMDKVEKDIENAKEPKSFLESLKDKVVARLKGLREVIPWGR